MRDEEAGENGGRKGKGPAGLAGPLFPYMQVNFYYLNTRKELDESGTESSTPG
jgi:hypothetical protein